MKVIITGGTGFIGTHLTSALIARGHQVTIIDRSPQRHAALPGVSYVQADLLTDRLKPEWFNGMDAVVHLAGRNLFGVWTPSFKQSLYETRVVSAKHIVDIISHLPDETRPRVIVSANSTGYYGNRGDEVLVEEDAAGRDFMAKLCIDWQNVWSPLDNLGVRVVIIRSGVVLHQSGGMLRRLLPVFKLHMGAVLGSGKQWFSWIGLNDLVRIYVSALENAQFTGPINAVAPKPLRNRDFTRELARALGKKAFLRIPGWAFRVLGSDISISLLASQRVKPAKLLDNRFEYDHPTIQSAVDAN